MTDTPGKDYTIKSQIFWEKHFYAQPKLSFLKNDSLKDILNLIPYQHYNIFYINVSFDSQGNSAIPFHILKSIDFLPNEPVFESHSISIAPLKNILIPFYTNVSFDFQ